MLQRFVIPEGIESVLETVDRRGEDNQVGKAISVVNDSFSEIFSSKVPILVARVQFIVVAPGAFLLVCEFEFGL